MTLKYNRFRYVGKITVGKLGWFIEGEYFFDTELPIMMPVYNKKYGEYKVIPYSHVTSKNRMGEFRKLLHVSGGNIR